MLLYTASLAPGELWEVRTRRVLRRPRFRRQEATPQLKPKRKTSIVAPPGRLLPHSTTAASIHGLRRPLHPCVTDCAQTFPCLPRCPSQPTASLGTCSTTATELLGRGHGFVPLGASYLLRRRHGSSSGASAAPPTARLCSGGTYHKNPELHL